MQLFWDIFDLNKILFRAEKMQIKLLQITQPSTAPQNTVKLLKGIESYWKFSEILNQRKFIYLFFLFNYSNFDYFSTNFLSLANPKLLSALLNKQIKVGQLVNWSIGQLVNWSIGNPTLALISLRSSTK